jgi:hypothetical protein
MLLSPSSTPQGGYHQGAHREMLARRRPPPGMLSGRGRPREHGREADADELVDVASIG